MYKLAIKLVDGSVLVSTWIVPNNPNHGMDHRSIPREIHKTGKSMVKRLKGVVSYDLLCSRWNFYYGGI